MNRMYIEYAKISFQNNIAYRVETLVSIFNTVITIFVYVAIWTSIFKQQGSVNGYQLSSVTTHFVISLGLSTIYINMTSEVSWKVVSGDIANDLLRPINYFLLMLSKSVGTVLYRVLLQLLPAFIISFLILDIKLPSSFIHLILFLVSIVLGFLVYFMVDFMISITAFWFHRVFFMMQIKNALMIILSGAMLPIWFLPDTLRGIIKFAPFESIYFTPINIYLAHIPIGEIALAIGKQCFWIVGLYFVCIALWNSGIKKLVIQGG